MPLHSTLPYRVVVGLLIAGAIVLLATIAVPLLRRGGERELQAAKDSLVIARSDLKRSMENEANAEKMLDRATSMLDSVLATKPPVVYVKRTMVDTVHDSVVVSVQDSTPYVPLASYTQLESRCADYESSCQAKERAADSTKRDLNRIIASQGNIIVEKDAQLKREHRASFFAHVRDFGWGAGTGALACSVFKN